MKQRVVMVCLGNICRSPLAQGILESKVDKKKVFVDSAGVASWHVGKTPDTRSIAVAAAHQIDIAQQKARQFTKEDFNNFDRIYVMDKQNYKDVLSLASSQEQKNKVELILNVVDSTSTEVPDPYYGGADGFEKVYNQLDKACQIIAASLESTK